MMPPRKQVKKSGSMSRYLSLLLIITGIVLMGVGVFSYAKEQVVLLNNQPPPLPAESSGGSLADNPLPVVANEVSAASTVSDTPTPSPSPTLLPIDTPVSGVDAAPPATTVKPPTPTVTPMPTLTPTPDPFPPAQSSPNRIVIEAIGLDSPVVDVGWHEETVGGQAISVWDVAEFAAGWHKNSTLPGNMGNIVLSGHHNIKGEVFRYIVDLEPGQTITLYADGRAYDYVVEDKFILKDKGEPEEVRRANARWIGPFDDKRVTLVTCWPYNNNTHRVVVVAKPPRNTAQ